MSLNRPITLSNSLCIIIILALLVSNIFFAFKHSALEKELEQAKADLDTQKTDKKILDFTELFIEKVLQAEGEVDFETRLGLENAIRNLKDEEISIQWQKFIESKTETEAQIEVKNLLKTLINRAK